MAIQQADGSFKSNSGQQFDNEHAAQTADMVHARSGGGGGAMAGMGGLLNIAGPAMIIIPIVGAIVCIAFMLLAGLRGFIIIAKTLPLFMVSGIIGLCVGVFVFIKVRIGIILRLLVFCLVSLVAAAPFVVGSYFIYCRTSIHFPTMFSADYVLELPDGTAPKVYQKRFQKGKVLGELEIDERITVNGISMDYKEYNITTASGITGWIPVAALPEDNAEMLAITIGVDGFTGAETASDRLAVRLMKKYMDETKSEETLYGIHAVRYSYTMPQQVLNRSSRVNLETPIMYISSKDYSDGGELMDSGHKVTLANIVYAEDCTILYFSAMRNIEDPTMTWLRGAPANISDWEMSLCATDLDTGEKWQVLPYNYSVSYTRLYEKDVPDTLTLIFPPFKSRHFSLTHEISPMPDRKNVDKGFTGVIGFVADLTVRHDSDRFYNDWNFPEVRIR